MVFEPASCVFCMALFWYNHHEVNHTWYAVHFEHLGLLSSFDRIARIAIGIGSGGWDFGVRSAILDICEWESIGMNKRVDNLFSILDCALV